jgi:hypothetical protein
MQLALRWTQRPFTIAVMLRGRNRIAARANLNLLDARTPELSSEEERASAFW